MKGILAVSNAIILKSRELAADTVIPYVRHADAHTIVLKSRAVMTMIVLDGISFETADISDINALHRDLNTLLRNIGDERLALWSHIIRLRSNEYPDGEFSNAFAAALDAKYRARMTGEELFQNDLYLTLVWSPAGDVTEQVGALVKRLRKARRDPWRRSVRPCRRWYLPAASQRAADRMRAAQGARTDAGQ